MKLYLYNNDISEQSIRQMQTIIPFLDNCEVYLENRWNELLIEKLSVKFSNFEDFLLYNGDKGIMYFNILDGYSLLKHKKKNKNLFFILRPRGLPPEESYYKHNKYLRKFILNYIESKVIESTNYFVFLEQVQRVHFLSKYQKYTEKFDNYSIIPNIANIHKNDNSYISVKDNIKLVYSGGFSKWQNIELIFMLVNEIVKTNNERKDNKKIIFTILTFESNFEIIKEYAKKHRISNEIEFKYVLPKEMNNELSKCDIGIIIRDSNIVNTAASPFKIMDYITNGLGLIITNNISYQVKNILQDDYYFELDFINNNIIYDKDKLHKFIVKFSDRQCKKDILDEYKSYISRINKINIDSIYQKR